MTDNIEMQLEQWLALQGRVKKLVDKYESLLWSGYTQFSTREQRDIFHLENLALPLESWFYTRHCQCRECLRLYFTTQH